MRLAAEYQQGKKQQQQGQQNGRKYIVRLGKGVPGQQKRKRGISISRNNSNFQEQSLGRNQVSREKQRQQVLTSQRQIFAIRQRKPPEEKVLASVATYANQPKKVNGYVAQHLFDMKPKETQLIVATGKYLSGVKSQENLAIRQSSRLISDKNASKIIAGPIISTRYISPKAILLSQSRPASKSSRNTIEINSKIIQNSSNIRAYETPTIKQQGLFIQNPASIPIQQGPRLKSEEPVKINVIKEYKSQVNDIANSRRTVKQKEQLANTSRNTEKLISSQANIDPYSLSSLQLTKKNGQYQMASEELVETKKYLKGVPQCKEVSSSNVSGGSKSNVKISRTGPISLWDANKVESIVSMKSSREIKVQQSEIMHDYFHPSESMLKKI